MQKTYSNSSRFRQALLNVTTCGKVMDGYEIPLEYFYTIKDLFYKSCKKFPENSTERDIFIYCYYQLDGYEHRNWKVYYVCLMAFYHGILDNSTRPVEQVEYLTVA